MANKSTIPYGINITASDAQGAIDEAYRDRAGVNTWKKLLGQAGAEYTAQAGALQEDYNSAVSEAYRASLERENAIERGGYAAGSRDKLLSENRQLLLDAYDSYFKNFGSGMQTIGEEYGQNISAIEQALNDEAGNVSKLLGKLYEYSKSELADTSREYEVMNEKGELTTLKSNIYKALREGGLAEGFFNISNDTDGEEIWSLKDWQDIQGIMFDENRNLTPEGVNFYMSLMNLEDTQGYRHSDESAVRSFGNWLYDTDSDLYDWYNSADPYNYTEDGRRSGTIRQLLGQSSTDYTNRISGDESRQMNAPAREKFTNDVSYASTKIDTNIAEIDKLIDTTIGEEVNTTELDNLIKTMKEKGFSPTDEKTFTDALNKARNDAGKAAFNRDLISAAYRKNFAEGKMNDSTSKSILEKVNDIIENTANLDNASIQYKRLYGEDMDSAYETNRKKLETWVAGHQGKQLSMKDVNDVKDILTNMRTAIGDLQTKTKMEQKNVVGDAYGMNFWKNAKTAENNITTAIDSAGGFDRSNKTVADTINEAYNQISDDMNIVLGTAKKSRMRDLVISYGDGTKFTVDRRAGVGKGSDGWDEVEDATLRTELNGKYGNSLLAVQGDRVYMQYEKGHWIDVYPKRLGDKGSDQKMKDQFKVLKTIAYKMMLENNMEIAAEQGSTEVWAKNGKLLTSPGAN